MLDFSGEKTGLVNVCPYCNNVLGCAVVCARVIKEYLLLSLHRVRCMRGKIKTSILIDEDIWEAFKVKASSRKGLKGISRAVEDALEEELSEKVVTESLENMCPRKLSDLEVKPIKPKIATSAGKVISELREQAV